MKNGRNLLEIFNGNAFIDDETTDENEGKTIKGLGTLERGTKRICLCKL